MTLDLDRVRTRFWKKVKKTRGCWIWLGKPYQSNGGYGGIEVFDLQRGKWRQIVAHRVAWMLIHGEIHGDICVLHKCDNKICVRPGHLFLGSRQDNTADMVRKGRQAHGDRSGVRKLSSAKVRQMRKEAEMGAPNSDLSKKYGVRHCHVWRIVTGRSWRDL